jgi:hypothetical protein
MADQWFMARQGKKDGPHSLSDMKQMAASGQVRPDDMVLQPGTTKWVRASQIEAFFLRANPWPNNQVPGRQACSEGGSALLGAGAPAAGPPQMPPAPVAMPVAGDTAEWHYVKNGREGGPVSWPVLKDLAESGRLCATDLVWQAGMPGWAPASTVPCLAIRGKPASSPEVQPTGLPALPAQAVVPAVPALLISSNALPPSGSLPNVQAPALVEVVPSDESAIPELFPAAPPRKASLWTRARNKWRRLSPKAKFGTVAGLAASCCILVLCLIWARFARQSAPNPNPLPENNGRYAAVRARAMKYLMSGIDSLEPDKSGKISQAAEARLGLNLIRELDGLLAQIEPPPITLDYSVLSTVSNASVGKPKATPDLRFPLKVTAETRIKRFDMRRRLVVKAYDAEGTLLCDAFVSFRMDVESGDTVMGTFDIAWDVADKLHEFKLFRAR